MNSQLLKITSKFENPELITKKWKLLISKEFSSQFLFKWIEEATDAVEVELLSDVLLNFCNCGKTPNELSQMMDDSPYSVRDWAEATLLFFNEQGSKLPPEKTASAFGYLSCCAETGAQSPTLESFREIVEQMLKTYGYEGSA